MGGLREAKKCESAGVGIAPHNPLGPIAGIAAPRFALSTPTHVIWEEMVGAVPEYDDVVQWPIERTPGCWALPEKPGLEVNEAEIVCHPCKQEVLHIRNAVLPEGAIVDW